MGQNANCSLALFLRENFGLEPGVAGAIYSTFLGLVYFMPLVGGILADKFGFGKMVTSGIFIMFIGILFTTLLGKIVSLITNIVTELRYRV